jgi:hypothetical protein
MHLAATLLDLEDLLALAVGKSQQALVVVSESVGTANRDELTGATDGGAVRGRRSLLLASALGSDLQTLGLASSVLQKALVRVGLAIGTTDGDVFPGASLQSASGSLGAFTFGGLGELQVPVAASFGGQLTGVTVGLFVGTTDGGVDHGADIVAGFLIGGRGDGDRAGTNGGLGDFGSFVLASSDTEVASVGVGDAVGTADGGVDSGAGGGAGFGVGV